MTGKPVKVKITYCAECGYEPQALELTKSLMYEFGGQLSAIELIPWESGTFDVSVGSDLIHSMRRDGGFPQYASVRAAVRARVDAPPTVQGR